MNHRQLAPLLALALAPATASADFSLGYSSWDYDIRGFVDNRGDVIDLERDIDVQVRAKHGYQLRWDTGPGWLPDLAASWFRIDAGGRSEFTSEGGIGPIPLPPTTTVVLADADLDDYDLTLRYPAHPGGTTLWGGVTVKRLDGEITTRDEEDTQETTEPVDETVPLLHAEWLVPLGEHLQVAARGNWLSYDGNEALELRALASLRLWRRLELSAGWQRKQYRIETTNYRLDTTLDGALLGIGLRLP